MFAYSAVDTLGRLEIILARKGAKAQKGGLEAKIFILLKKILNS